MKNIGFAITMLCLTVMPISAGDPPANSDVALEDSFDRDELGKGWNSTTGDWKIVDGVLRGSEIAAEKHSAATRRVVETKNAVYELKFRFIDEGKAFQVMRHSRRRVSTLLDRLTLVNQRLNPTRK